MSSLLHYLDSILALPNDRFALPPATQRFLESYLARHGYQLSAITSHAELLAALRFCNAADFERLVQTPAPAAGQRFLWNRLRKLGR